MHEYEHIIKDNYVEFYLYNRDENRYTCYVDLEDWNRVKNYKYKWHIAYNKKCIYIQANVYLGMYNGKPKYTTCMLHRFIFNCTDEIIKIDHKDHNGLDNRKNNMRMARQDTNSRHKSGKNKNNTSGYRNVSWNKYYEKWVVQLQVKGTNKILGYFDDVHEAGKYAHEMREKYYGEFAGKD